MWENRQLPRSEQVWTIKKKVKNKNKKEKALIILLELILKLLILAKRRNPTGDYITYI